MYIHWGWRFPWDQAAKQNRTEAKFVDKWENPGSHRMWIAVHSSPTWGPRQWNPPSRQSFERYTWACTLYGEKRLLHFLGRSKWCVWLTRSLEGITPDQGQGSLEMCEVAHLGVDSIINASVYEVNVHLRASHTSTDAHCPARWTE